MKCCFEHFSSCKKRFQHKHFFVFVVVVDDNNYTTIILYDNVKMIYCPAKCTVQYLAVANKNWSNVLFQLTSKIQGL